MVSVRLLALNPTGMFTGLRLSIGCTVMLRGSPPLDCTPSTWPMLVQVVIFCAVPVPLPAGYQVVSDASKPSRLKLLASMTLVRNTE